MEIPEAQKEIEMPASTPIGLIVSICAAVLGFGMIWHMWWLAALMLAAIAVCLVVRSFDTKIEREVRI